MAKFLYYTTEQMIRFFLEQGKEGEFWDFKEEWHSDKNELIKDIICFANTIHDETCYIVFGITDDLKIVGVKNSKYKQADILDMISQLMFAGDVYPRIELESIVFEGKNLDVLKILNEDKTPIYLKKAHGNMNANCIYMRLGDKNTPDKSNAHISDIELLWKKRLGLLKTPHDYIYDRLDNKLEWVSAADEKDADEEKEKEEEIPSTNQPKPKVNKVGIIDLKDYGFPKDKTTEIELRYDGKVIEKRTVSNENNTKVEVAVEIESNVESVDLALWYDGKQRQTISVNLTESK